MLGRCAKSKQLFCMPVGSGDGLDQAKEQATQMGDCHSTSVFETAIKSSCRTANLVAQQLSKRWSLCDGLVMCTEQRMWLVQLWRRKDYWVSRRWVGCQRSVIVRGMRGASLYRSHCNPTGPRRIPTGPRLGGGPGQLGDARTARQGT